MYDYEPNATWNHQKSRLKKGNPTVDIVSTTFTSNFYSQSFMYC